jgi:hypothetical protein
MKDEPDTFGSSFILHPSSFRSKSLPPDVVVP